MKNELLQPLLKAGLLNIGDSDERLDNIEKSIIDIENLLKENLSLIPSYTLVALDPNIGADEPVLIEVEAIISEHWKALRAKFTEIPIQIIRAVIINALYNIGKEDTKTARIVYLTAINLYPFVKLKKEKAIIEQLITEFGDIAEKNATEEWALSSETPKVVIPTLKIDKLTIDNIELETSDLESGLLKAIQNEPSAGYGTQHGGNTAWGKYFAKNATESIKDVFESSFAQLDDVFSTASIEKPINKFFTEFKNSLNNALNKSFGSILAIERRSKLLWWKETLYSSSLKNSYRSVNEIQQAVIMAKDLYMQLPSIVPASVDYLLRDTLLLLNSKANKKTKISELLVEIAKPENSAVLRNHLQNFEFKEKRISITNFIVLLIYNQVEVSSLTQFTGIDESNQVSLLDLSVMILHDLMAVHLTTNN